MLIGRIIQKFRLPFKAEPPFLLIFLALLLSSTSTMAADAGLSKPSVATQAEAANKNALPRSEPRETPRGPLHEAAIRSREEAEERIRATEAAERARVAAPSSTPIACEGAGCSSAAATTRAAEESARTVAATAASQQKAAEEERKKILAEVKRGAAEKKYTRGDVDRFQEMFKSSSRPPTEDIEQLPKPLHDPAFALRENNRKMQRIHDTVEQYGRVGTTARQMGATLAGHSERAHSLSRSASATVGAITSSSARKAERSSSSGSAKGSQGSTGDSSPASLENGIGSLMESRAPSGGNPDKSADTEAMESFSISESEKKLNGEGTDLMASMLSELKSDIGSAMPTSADPGHQATVRGEASSSSPADRFGGHSIIGDAILAFSAAGPEKLGSSATAGRSLASPNINLADLDFLGVDKSLFVRVNEQMRRRARDSLSSN